MLRTDRSLTPKVLLPRINRLFELSGDKIRNLEAAWDPRQGAPVFTVQGRYTARGWTEWTEGFQYGAALLQFDATDDPAFLDLGRERTLTRMAPHLTHVGVHDHGFNNVSTYGALWRMAIEGRIEASEWERRFYALALKVSGAIQARRWTSRPGGGYIYSFNGAHSLFVDTIRSLRALALSHLLGHRLVEEQDAQINLLQRLIQHARATAEFNVFYGTTGAPFDVRGRVAHESLFNVANGTYRGPEYQQGYSPFSTWTRGLAWAMLGFCGTARIPEHAYTCRRGNRRCHRRSAAARRRGTSRLRLLYRFGGLHRRRSLLGHGRARTVVTRRLGEPGLRSVQRSSSPSTVPRRQLARRASCASAGSSTGAAMMEAVTLKPG